MNTYDVIVIGAGNGGLMAALRLVKAGKKVLVLESHGVPGGFATSFVRGRFEFEASLHELCEYGSIENPGSVLTLFNELGICDLPMQDVPEAYHVITLEKEQKEEYTMPFGEDAFIAKMEEYVPRSRKSMEEFFRLCREVKKAFKYFDESKGNPDTNVLLKEHSDFMHVGAYSVEKVLNAIGMPLKAQGILTTYWTYLGSPVSSLSFVHFASMLYSYITLGAQIPLSRSHFISMRLANEILENGGSIFYRREVEEIFVSEEGVQGVRCKNKEEYYAKEIICNLSPTNVYGKIIDSSKVSEKARKLTNARTLGARGLCLYLGLNRSAFELGLDKYSYFIYHSLDSNKEFERMKTLENDSMVGVVLNNAIPECSEEGTTILYLTSLYFGDVFDKSITKENYFEMKEKLANQFIDRFEKATGTSIRDAIEEVELATPLTYKRYTGHPDGVIYGYMAKGYDNLLPRLMARNEENYIHGLHFCGGFGVRLSGYSSSYLSGDLAGKEVLLEMEGK